MSAVSLPDITSGERTEIVYGVENVTKFSAYGLSIVENRVDVCGDYTMPSVILASGQVRNGYYELNKKGVKIRWITDITKENISSCKEITNIAELRHLDGVKGGFVVCDEKVYVATALLQMEKPVIQLIYSNVKALVEQQQYMFNTLWDKAIPSKQRMGEIEEGLKREFIETIRDPVEIQNLAFSLLRSATDEILIVFSTVNAFHYLRREGLLDTLEQLIASNHDMRVRILVEMDEQIKELYQKLELKVPQIHIQNIYKPLHTKITTIIVDSSFSLTIEMKDDVSTNNESRFSDTVGLSSYSNSESVIASYTSIFESLSIQGELEEQKKKK